MNHVEVHHAHLFTFSLLGLGIIALLLLVLGAIVAGLIVWRGRRRRLR